MDLGIVTKSGKEDSDLDSYRPTSSDSISAGDGGLNLHQIGSVPTLTTDLSEKVITNRERSLSAAPELIKDSQLSNPQIVRKKSMQDLKGNEPTQ